MMTSKLPKTSVAEILADKIVALKPGVLPAPTAQSDATLKLLATLYQGRIDLSSLRG